ncbi:uncharacterized protein LOC122563066 isoform X1 [Chiloscyllium plagiosum]|uniref:uncharacterized protein LOC122563066 isoform X1 n=1 Tax=Chiloscyllium plagiosum TaxID=36176 RepID=UPI001CB7F63D|nr:uncharacterized protein LOC122563066 isoform X1 [Chiloscyllium plagiosum]
MRTFLLFLMVLCFDRQLANPLEMDWDRDVSMRRPQLAVRPFDHTNSEELHQAVGFPCSSHPRDPSVITNSKNPLYNLFRRQQALSWELCIIKLILNKHHSRGAELDLVKREKDLVKREKDSASYNWNSFGLRYGKSLVDGEKK